MERLKAMGFSPTARLGMGDAGREIARVAREIEANLVVVGHPNSEIDQLLPWAYRRQVLKAVA